MHACAPAHVLPKIRRHVAVPVRYAMLPTQTMHVQPMGVVYLHVMTIIISTVMAQAVRSIRSTIAAHRMRYAMLPTPAIAVTPTASVRLPVIAIIVSQLQVVSIKISVPTELIVDGVAILVHLVILSA